MYHRHDTTSKTTRQNILKLQSRKDDYVGLVTTLHWINNDRREWGCLWFLWKYTTRRCIKL